MAQENGKIVFRWHFLIIYLLIAAVISYELVDYKMDRDAPTTTAEPTAHDEIKVTKESDSGFDVDDDSQIEYVEPGTIQEYTSEKETTTDESTTEKESETKKKETTKKETTTKKKTTTTKKEDTTKATTTTTKATTTTTKTTTTTTKPTTTKAAETTTSGTEEPATVAEDA